MLSNLQAGPSRQPQPPAAGPPVARPLWYYTAAGKVVAEQALRPGDEPRLWCREGSAWTEYRTGSPPVTAAAEATVRAFRPGGER